MQDLVKTVDCYFETVINDEDFVLCLDNTGVYAFTEELDVEVVLLKFQRMLRTLSLKGQEAVLCLVTDEQVETTQVLNVATPENLEKWIRTKTGSRKRMLSDDDLLSIADCYFEGEDDEDSISDLLRELEIPEAVILSLLEVNPITVGDVMKFGIDRETSYQVLRVFTEDKERLLSTNSTVERGVTIALDSYVKNKVVIAICFAIGSLVLSLFRWSAVACCCAGVGFWFALKGERVNDDVTARFIKWANVFIFILGALPLMKLGLEHLVPWLVEQGFLR